MIKFVIMGIYAVLAVLICLPVHLYLWICIKKNNYIGWKKEKDGEHEYCAVVISEDGIHDIIDTKTIDKIAEDLDDPYGNG